MAKNPKPMDNCSAQELLISREGLVKAMFLTSNVTSLIQPMDQGALETLKRQYRKSLLRDILLSDGEVYIVEFLKSVNMKVVIEKVAISWMKLVWAQLEGPGENLFQWMLQQKAIHHCLITNLALQNAVHFTR